MIKTFNLCYRINTPTMKILKYIGLGILSLLILLLVVSLFLPINVRVERSITINTEASVPFNLINNLEAFNSWSPWYNLDTTALYKYSDTLIGESAWISWISNNNKVGKGKLTILKNITNEVITTKLDFEDRESSLSEYNFSTQDNTTTLTWSMESNFGYNLIGRWFGLFMDDMIGADYENGLLKIKQICETQPLKENIVGFDVTLINMPEENYLYIINKHTPVEEIGLKISENLLRLDKYFKLNNITPSTPPFTAWYSNTHFVTGMGFSGEPPLLDKGIKLGKLNAGDAYVVSYYGAYNNTKLVHENMESYLLQKGKTLSAPPREVYVTDPLIEPDSLKWLTEIVFPVN